MTDERLLTCAEALRVLAEYLDGELDAVSDRDVGRHLERCRSCYSRAEFERRLKQHVATLGQSAVRSEFEARIRGLINRFSASSDAAG